MLRAIEYREPDRIPLYYHRSPAGMYVHGKKVLDIIERCPPDNVVEFVIPIPEPGSFDERGEYRCVKQDEWGTVWEYKIFGIQGTAIEYPLVDMTTLRKYRLPPVPDSAGSSFEEERAVISNRKQDYLIFLGRISLFEKMSALRPVDDLLVDLFQEESGTMELLDRLVDHGLRSIDHWLALGAEVVQIGDDWGTQTGSFVSPDLFRRLFKPRYRKLVQAVKAGGGKVLFHSCGKLDRILDELMELGIDCLWPQINRYEEASLFETCRRNRVALLIHPDRQYLVPLGSPEEIRETVQRYSDICRKNDGGGIFYLEVENDVPFENVAALIESAYELG